MIYTYLRFHLGTPFENQVIVHTAGLINNNNNNNNNLVAIKTSSLTKYINDKSRIWENISKLLHK